MKFRLVARFRFFLVAFDVLPLSVLVDIADAAACRCRQQRDNDNDDSERAHS